jgi:hypothetical protein
MITCCWIFVAGVALMCIGVCMAGSRPRYRDDWNRYDKAIERLGFKLTMSGMIATIAGLAAMYLIAIHVIA